jgi:hypothetical protein
MIFSTLGLTGENWGSLREALACVEGNHGYLQEVTFVAHRTSPVRFLAAFSLFGPHVKAVSNLSPHFLVSGLSLSLTCFDSGFEFLPYIERYYQFSTGE